MRYRELKENDYTLNSLLSNSPSCVGQAVRTRLMLFTGEWFLDTSDGTPWFTEVLGSHTKFYDLAIKERILNTQGVKSIISYYSQLDVITRELSIQVELDTIYGITSLSVGR